MLLLHTPMLHLQTAVKLSVTLVLEALFASNTNTDLQPPLPHRINHRIACQASFVVKAGQTEVPDCLSKFHVLSLHVKQTAEAHSQAKHANLSC